MVVEVGRGDGAADCVGGEDGPDGGGGWSAVDGDEAACDRPERLCRLGGCPPCAPQ